MSTAKRLVLSLAGRNDSQQTPGASSTRLVGNSLSPGHELDEIAIVSHGGTETCGRVSYGSLSLNGPRYIPGKRELISLHLSFPLISCLRELLFMGRDSSKWFISKLSMTIIFSSPVKYLLGPMTFFLPLFANESSEHTFYVWRDH